uniref:Uncharacterized protein n=1 Tax=Esox lucius TaxID=8010 RepID=A0A6Q2YFQ3_ESOLU
MVLKTEDCVKAESCPGLTFRPKGSMMELQTLQEALKVEIQVHQKLVAQMKQDPQNADLKKQLHELQAKITALSEKQGPVRRNQLVYWPKTLIETDRRLVAKKQLSMGVAVGQSKEFG